VGEILGLGMSHYPGMRSPAPERFTIGATRRPDIPDEYKDPKNWPARMREQIGDDEGRSHILAHRDAFIRDCRVLRRKLDEFNPDFVLVWGDDLRSACSAMKTWISTPTTPSATG
jgi:hypothetical protein